MRQRQGFTITELLVAFALIMFIMVILTEAFSAGLESFRHLKAIGDMQARIRSVSIILRRDLKSEHFENYDFRGNRLSNQDMRTMPPPDEGYFRIWQRLDPASANALAQCSTREAGQTAYEGADTDGIPSTISTDHVLAFTIRQRGGTLPANFYTTPLPAGFPAIAQTQLQGTVPV